jgi:O-antigen/teichoic acid export membrane protein
LNGGILYVLSQWVLLVILAKLGGPEVVGRYTLGLAVTAPIMLFFNLQLRALLASDVQGTFPFSAYAFLRLLTSLGALLLICGIAFGLKFTQEQAIVISLVGLAKTTESGSDIVYGVMQKNERMDLIGMSKSMRGALSAGVVGVILYGTGSLIAGVIALNLVWLVVFILVDCRHLGKFVAVPLNQLTWSNLTSATLATRTFKLCKLALPLGIVSMLMSYNSSLPRYFMDAYHGETALGYFSAIAYFTVACTIVPEAFGQATLPRLAKYDLESSREFWHLLGKLILMATLIGVTGLLCAMLIGSEILSLVYQPEFGEFSAILAMVMILGTTESICSVLGVGLTASRMLTPQVTILSVVVMVTAFSGWWLVPNHAMEGAVIAAICGMVVWGAAYFWVLVMFRNTQTPRFA